MSHASGLIRFKSDNKIGHYEYDGTADVVISHWYETAEERNNDWLTAFYVGYGKKFSQNALTSLVELDNSYNNREWLIKAPHKRTVKLFHIHLIKKQ